MIHSKQLFAIILLSSACSYAMADDAATKQTLPTASSKPLPTLQTVKNIDTVLSEKVQSELTKQPSLKGQSVSAASHEQVITLEGSVETQAQADVAIKTAQSVPGVKDVKSQLTIKGQHSQ